MRLGLADALRIICLDGDGIGPEIVSATVRALKAVRPALSRPLDLRSMDIGFAALEQHGSTIPNDVVEAAREADGVVLGPVSHNDYPPVAEGGLNPSGVLRRELGVYANIRPARTRAGVPSPSRVSFDLVVVRENLEGFYADRSMHAGGGEFMPVPGVALAVRKITEAGSRRIAVAAFDLARSRAAKRVAAVHKANVLRMSDGLFLDTVRDVQKAYPDVAYEEVLVDAAAAHLVRSPDRFDVLLATNMYGDILSDLASELAGGLGLAASLNLGDDVAVAQAQHGSAPDIAGKDQANPVSLTLSMAMLLRHLGESRAAGIVEDAVEGLLAAPDTRTADLGGSLGTRAFAGKLVQAIERAAA